MTKKYQSKILICGINSREVYDVFSRPGIALI
jgi:hypothetical protein